MPSESVGRTGGTDTGPATRDGGGSPSQRPFEETQQPSRDAESGSENGVVPQGVVFDILRNERRRRVLKHLDDADGRATLGEMAERLAAVENDKPESQITSQERKRLYVGLYQCHLPRMDESGAVAFDDDRGTIETTEHTESFLDHLPEDDADVEHDDRGTIETTEHTESFLDHLPEDGADVEHDDRWAQYYLAISALGAGLLALEVAGALGGAVGPRPLLGGIVLAVGVCSGLHWYVTRAPPASESD